MLITHITLNQIGELETIFATFTSSGWEIPEWLKLLRSTQESRMKRFGIKLGKVVYSIERASDAIVMNIDTTTTEMLGRIIEHIAGNDPALMLKLVGLENIEIVPHPHN